MSAAKMFILVFAYVVFLNMQSTVLAQSTPQDYLDAHNNARSAVGVDKVTWSDELQSYAEWHVKKIQWWWYCKPIYSGGPYGENIYVGPYNDHAGVDAVKSWVYEGSFYDCYTNTCAAGTCSDYTQVVWSNTTQIGCATANGVCYNKQTSVVVCEYYTAGNVPGVWPYKCK